MKTLNEIINYDMVPEFQYVILESVELWVENSLCIKVLGRLTGGDQTFVDWYSIV